VFWQKLFYHLRMSFILSSVGKFCRLGVLALILGLVGCARSPQVQSEKEGTTEVSVLQDQKTIEELRKNIPPEKRKENDLLKETLTMTGDGDEPPHRVRERFQKLVRKAQDEHRKSAQRARDDFNKKERREREKFLKDLENEREDFREKKADREKSRDFYADLDVKRKDFFADQRERRNEFEAEQRESGDNFRAMIRDRNMQFDQEYRNYVKRYDEKKREAEAKRKMPTPTAAFEPLQSGQKQGQ
jgi:hypothetical protein